MADTERTKERLARDLEAAGAPGLMVRKARRGEYDDYESDSATPIRDLVRDCTSCGTSALKDIAKRAVEGHYDGTKEEADAWFAREGSDLFRGIRRTK